MSCMVPKLHEKVIREKSCKNGRNCMKVGGRVAIKFRLFEYSYLRYN